MTDMVEKVAMTIAKEQLNEGDGLYDWYALTDEVADGYRLLARAAIEAMREPTEEMAMSGAGKHSGNDYFSPEDFPKEAVEIYGAMIDAAIKPSESLSTEKG